MVRLRTARVHRAERYHPRYSSGQVNEVKGLLYLSFPGWYCASCKHAASLHSQVLALASTPRDALEMNGTGRIPESGTLQQIAAQTRIVKRRKQVNVASNPDLAIAFHRCLDFSVRVVSGQ